MPSCGITLVGPYMPNAANVCAFAVAIVPLCTASELRSAECDMLPQYWLRCR